MNIIYIVIAILAISVLVIGHELGHFLLAKANNVKVEEFSIGMGPKIFGVKGKETEYALKAFPIGGYVKMLGEEEQSSDIRSFSNKAPERKLSIIAAGPIMNFVLAIVFFMLIAFSKGYVAPIISSFTENSAAQKAGLQKGDQIVKIENTKVVTWEDLYTVLYTAKDKKLAIDYKRDGKVYSINLAPTWDAKENRYLIGISPTAIEHPTFIQSVNYGFNETISLIKQTFVSFKTIFTGKASLNDVGGPVTIIKISGEAAKAGFWQLLYFCAFISVQLAIFNIIPFPALDGGWIFLLLFEIITRKKVDDNKVAIVNYVGFTLLMILMVLVTIKDIFFPVNF